MGSGQSKYYRNSNHQYPYPPQPPPVYPGQYNQPFIPQYAPAYGPQMYPQRQTQGFIPPGVYGQAAQLPPPLLNWLPQDRRKSRRSKQRPRESERFVGGFGGSAQPARQEAPRRDRSQSRRRESQDHAPVIPQTQPPKNPSVASHRVPTPFNPRFREQEEDDEEEEEEDRPRSRGTERRHSSSRQSARYSPPHSINGDFAHVMQPLEPANPVVFGPTGPRPSTPLNNPLPPPPRDIYEMSPYKALLTLPQTAALLTASYGPHMATVTNGQPTKPVERKKSIAKGLLRAFSKREKKVPQPQVHFVPVFVKPDQNQSNQNLSQNQNSNSNPNPSQSDLQNIAQATSRPASYYPTSTAQQAADLVRAISQTKPAFANQFNGPKVMPSGASQIRVGMMQATQSTQSVDNMYPPVPPSPSSPPAVRFSQDSPYGVFMNHSPHRVRYQGIEYLTATHLFESMKFLETRPEVVQQLRACPRVQDLYGISKLYEADVRPDWPYIHLQKMEEVLLLKFRQHADLRMRLLATADARIIYSDPEDKYWGVDAHEEGHNYLGIALVHVRDKLRAEMQHPS